MKQLERAIEKVFALCKILYYLCVCGEWLGSKWSTIERKQKSCRKKTNSDKKAATRKKTVMRDEVMWNWNALKDLKWSDNKMNLKQSEFHCCSWIFPINVLPNSQRDACIELSVREFYCIWIFYDLISLVWIQSKVLPVSKGKRIHGRQGNTTSFHPILHRNQHIKWWKRTTFLRSKLSFIFRRTFDYVIQLEKKVWIAVIEVQFTSKKNLNQMKSN